MIYSLVIFHLSPICLLVNNLFKYFEWIQKVVLNNLTSQQEDVRMNILFYLFIYFLRIMFE